MSEEEKKAIKNAEIILKITTFLSDIRHKDLEILVNLINKLQKRVDELDKENQRQAELLSNIHNKYRKENEELKKDISNMYNKEVVISIICDNFDVTRLEVLEMLGEDE